MKCPTSGSDEVFHSRKGNRSLPPLKRLFMVALRCHRCCELFHRFRLQALDVPPAKSKRHRRAA